MTRLSLVLATIGVSHAVTPIEKVIQLMNEMVSKGDAAMKEEAVKFSAFDGWCTNQKRIKSDEIDAGNEKIQQLAAAIEKGAVEITALTARIQELDEDVVRWGSDQASAQAVRDKENADFKATVSDYAESLEALAGAITVLKKQSADRSQAELMQSLIQVKSSKMVPVSVKRAVMSFLQQPVADSTPDAMPADQLSIAAPEANAYENQSGGVVDMLQKLEKDFKTEKTSLEKEELGAMQAFMQIMQQLADNIEGAQHEINKKTTLRSETEAQKAEDEGAKEATIADRNEDQVYLDDTNALCTQKTFDFTARQKLRQEELDAIKKAIEIMSSGTVKGAGEKHLPQFLQFKSQRRALLQIKSESPIQSELSDFLAARAKQVGSTLLAQVAVAAANDPFKKVKKMIKDLVSKLTQEATEEMEQKGWCDTEVTTNTQTRNKKTEEVNILTSEIEDLTALIAQLTQEIADLTAQLAELTDAMSVATNDRSESKSKNNIAISDAKAAQVAVEQAMAVLKDFYAKSAEATSLVQRGQRGPADDAPETFDDKPYTGMEGGTPVDFLEVILSDFSRLESETSAEESAEDEEFKTYMFEAEKDHALKMNDKKHKDQTKIDKESALHSTQEELKITQEALNGAVAYYEKLKPQCVDTGISYEERVKRREAEIQSLEEALKIFEGTAVDVA